MWMVFVNTKDINVAAMWSVWPRCPRDQGRNKQYGCQIIDMNIKCTGSGMMGTENHFVSKDNHWDSDERSFRVNFSRTLGPMNLSGCAVEAGSETAAFSYSTEGSLIKIAP